MQAATRGFQSLAPLTIALLWILAPPFAARAAEPVSFKDDIVPIIRAHCPDCHLPGGEGHNKSGLDMTSYEGLMKGTKFGPVVVPGDAFTSNLNVLIEGRASKEIQMPRHMKKLTSCDVDLFRRWVNQGARNN